jgi:hypothetical protein
VTPVGAVFPPWQATAWDGRAVGPKPARGSRSSPGTAESSANVTSRGGQEPQQPAGAEELETPPHVLEGRARQMLEEERGIVRCMVAELLEGRGQRVGRGRVPGLYPRDERRSLVAGEGLGPQRAAGVLQLTVVDAAQVNRVESGVPDQPGGGRLGLVVAGQEQARGGSRWWSSAMTPTDSELKARTPDAA